MLLFFCVFCFVFGCLVFHVECFLRLFDCICCENYYWYNFFCCHLPFMKLLFVCKSFLCVVLNKKNGKCFMICPTVWFFFFVLFSVFLLFFFSLPFVYVYVFFSFSYCFDSYYFSECNFEFLVFDV